MLLCYGNELLMQKDFMYNTRSVCIGLITDSKHAANDGMSGWPWWMYLELASPLCNVLHRRRREKTRPSLLFHVVVAGNNIQVPHDASRPESKSGRCRRQACVVTKFC